MASKVVPDLDVKRSEEGCLGPERDCDLLRCHSRTPLSPNFLLATNAITTTANMIEAIDFRKLELPVGLIPERELSACSLLYRCRRIIFCFALWSTLVVLLSGGQQEPDAAWIFFVVFAVTTSTIYFLNLLFERIDHSYMRIDQSVELWTAVSNSIASFADLLLFNIPEDGDISAEISTMLFLEEYVVALRLYEPQDPTTSSKVLVVAPDIESDDMTVPVPTEEAVSPRFLLNHLNLFLRGCFPQLPPNTVDGIQEPWMPVNIVLPDLVVKMKRNRNDAISVATAKARHTLLENISVDLDKLIRLFPYQYIFSLRVISVAYFLALPLTLSSVGVGWNCVPISIVVSSLVFPCMVAADDSDHMMTHCNAPCGYVSALSYDPLDYQWGVFITQLEWLQVFAVNSFQHCRNLLPAISLGNLGGTSPTSQASSGDPRHSGTPVD